MERERNRVFARGAGGIIRGGPEEGVAGKLSFHLLSAGFFEVVIFSGRAGKGRGGGSISGTAGKGRGGGRFSTWGPD